jgi:hypothetical protein
MALPWSFVYKITNSKHQITNKSQITNSKPVQRATQTLEPGERLFFLFGILNFGHCYLFVFWDFNKSMNFQ